MTVLTHIAHRLLGAVLCAVLFGLSAFLICWLLFTMDISIFAAGNPLRADLHWVDFLYLCAIFVCVIKGAIFGFLKGWVFARDMLFIAKAHRRERQGMMDVTYSVFDD